MSDPLRWSFLGSVLVLLLLLLPPPKPKVKARRERDRGEAGWESSRNGSLTKVLLLKGPGPSSPSAAADPELVPGRRVLVVRGTVEPETEDNGKMVVADKGVEGALSSSGGSEPAERECCEPRRWCCWFWLRACMTLLAQVVWAA